MLSKIREYDRNAPGAYYGHIKGGSQRNTQRRRPPYSSDHRHSSRERGGERGRGVKNYSGSKWGRPVELQSQSCLPNSHLRAEMGHSPGHNMLTNDQSPPIAESSATASTEGDNSQVSVIESKNMDSDSCDVWEEESIDTDGDFDDCETMDRFGDLMGHRLNDTRFEIICHDDEEGDMELLKKILLVMNGVPALPLQL
ncbi:hypothetical protein C0Q70_05354 [Pomacea canaliculata]|uniref:Uncharacterized protein n=1 Tax=Pomacea canaliculata TaxID=400727 RepID=A0A2T7PKY9_POMCA|nr:hypothetical protein C0Q70_05354 [Pomacea canaliculata]